MNHDHNVQLALAPLQAPSRPPSRPVVVAELGWSLFHERYVWSPSFLQGINIWNHVKGGDGGVPWFDEMRGREDGTQEDAQSANDDKGDAEVWVAAPDNGAR